MISFLFGFALLVPYWDGSGRAVPSIGIFPLFISATSGALIVTGRLRLAGKIVLVDILLTMAYIAILVPRWVYEQWHRLFWNFFGFTEMLTLSLSCYSWFELEDRGNRRWVGGGQTMVGTYGTATMMINVYAWTRLPVSTHKR